jgi:hypothetical protein
MRGKFAHRILFFIYIHNGYFISTSVCVSANCTVFNILTDITYIMHTECWDVSCVVSNFADESAVYIHIQRYVLFWI